MFPVDRLSVILISRMIFNLREAGTEVYEGTMEWRSRIERETAIMRFHVPTTIRDDVSDSLDEEGDNAGEEMGAHEDISA